MSDIFGAPAEAAAAVTASDSTVVNFRSLYIGATGNVAVTMKNGQVVTFVGVPTGMILPVVVTKVMATNTTATSIVGLS